MLVKGPRWFGGWGWGCTKCMGCMWRHSLQGRHNGRDSVSNHQPHDCLLSRLSRRRSKETSKLCITGLCAGNSPVTGEFPAQMASNAEKVSIWWRHYAILGKHVMGPILRKYHSQILIYIWHMHIDGLVQDYSNAWVTMNNDFWVRSEAICQWF